MVALGEKRKFWKQGFQLSLSLGVPSSEFQNLQSLDSQAILFQPPFYNFLKKVSPFCPHSSTFASFNPFRAVVGYTRHAYFHSICHCRFYPTSKFSTYLPHVGYTRHAKFHSICHCRVYPTSTLGTRGRVFKENILTSGDRV